MKKAFVLVALFVLPIVAYLFFASGINNFGKLPVLREDIVELNALDNSIRLQDQITILGFLGNDIALRQTNALNLNQKIYKRFYEFNDFQMVMVVPKGVEPEIEELKSELSELVDIAKWRFVHAESSKIVEYFDKLGANLSLESDLSTPHVFIIDKNRNLRGRTDDDEEGIKYGYNTNSVAELNNKMVDDVKIILAEYRLALKKNNAARSK